MNRWNVWVVCEWKCVNTCETRSTVKKVKELSHAIGEKECYQICLTVRHSLMRSRVNHWLW